MAKNECENMGKEEKQEEYDKGKYKPMSNDEIKKLAEDMYNGSIFTDRHVRTHEELPMVFMPLALMGKELAEELMKNPPGMIYEHIERAGPLSINGMPIFSSFRMISIEDTKKVLECYNKIKEAIANI